MVRRGSEPAGDPAAADATVPAGPAPETVPSATETQGVSGEAQGAIVPDAAMPAQLQPAASGGPARGAQPTEVSERPGPPTSGKGRIRRLFGWLVRAVVIVALVAGVGAGLYFGWPIVYDRYLAPVQTNTAGLDALRDQLVDLQRQVDELTSTDTTVEARLAAIDERLAALDAMDATLATSDRSAAAETARQISILKGMELMSRARLFMFQANYGLAEQDLEVARDILAGVAAGDPSGDSATIAVAVDRLDMALSALPDFPVAARDDLDIAWQAVLGRVPTPGAEPGASAVPGESAPPAPTASP